MIRHKQHSGGLGVPPRPAQEQGHGVTLSAATTRPDYKACRGYAAIIHSNYRLRPMHRS